MLETRAIVVKIEHGQALVESMQGGGCGHCQSSQGCSSGKLSQLFCTEARRYYVNNGINARVGDEVLLTIADGQVLRSALILYVFPLISMLAGGGLGSHWMLVANPDASAAIGAFVGLIAGFLLVRWAARRLIPSVSRPAIVRGGDATDSSF